MTTKAEQEEGRDDDDDEQGNQTTPQHLHDAVGWERRPQPQPTEGLETLRQEREARRGGGEGGGGDEKEEGQDE